MDDVRCPNCGTTKYANATMKMLVNVCGHSLCENCVENLFIKGAGRCPTCDVTLKRSQFKIQLYDDEAVEKDLQIRRKLLKELSLKAEDFGSLREYNDYLETFESFVYNLASGIDVQETQAAIEEFKAEHAARLKKSRGKPLSKEQLELEAILEEEAAAAASRSAYGFGASGAFASSNPSTIAAQKAAAAAARKESLLDQLIASDLPAEAILRSHQALMDREIAETEEAEARAAQQRALELRMLKSKNKSATVFSSGISLGGAKSGTVFFDEEDGVQGKDGAEGAELQGGSAGVRFVYKPPATVTSSGIPHCCPTPRTILRGSGESGSYIAHVRPPTEAESAAGFLALYPCQRALQEALLDLTFRPRASAES